MKLYRRTNQPITMARSWTCRNCHTDHGDSGCENPDFDSVDLWETVEVAMTPIPQCATHGLPIGQFGYDDNDLKPTECVGVVMGWHGYCRLGDQAVYRIEVTDE